MSQPNRARFETLIGLDENDCLAFVREHGTTGDNQRSPVLFKRDGAFDKLPGFPCTILIVDNYPRQTSSGVLVDGWSDVSDYATVAAISVAAFNQDVLANFDFE
jgi:hypothetical protein